eukprot:gnl/Hemi2/8942_TR3100_c0_g1_i1.p1 gnl/Hemi2/8942_TR3100_c0_g1~~gnl/Hemi2/8942_TR3100_c0_g1_i1.p1  ORF type:complete len:187 (-),score=71.01 gnl/Hemi2/8942_TR3100_c0_g1_i1:21-509(-)
MAGLGPEGGNAECVTILIAELKNAVGHLQRSNVELQSAIAAAADCGDVPDPDFVLAVVENRSAIERKLEHIASLEQLLAAQGAGVEHYDSDSLLRQQQTSRAQLQLQQLQLEQRKQQQEQKQQQEEQQQQQQQQQLQQLQQPQPQPQPQVEIVENSDGSILL